MPHGDGLCGLLVFLQLSMLWDRFFLFPKTTFRDPEIHLTGVGLCSFPRDSFSSVLDLRMPSNILDLTVGVGGPLLMGGRLGGSFCVSLQVLSS